MDGVRRFGSKREQNAPFLPLSAAPSDRRDRHLPIESRNSLGSSVVPGCFSLPYFSVQSATESPSLMKMRLPEITG